ncbi:threonine--tRNA ligase [candidate division WOR-1 bacterium RIFOXYA12_FULL_52_29]|uniref:Threonine--tRNA ligase n=1 Tax=candidate division WOR-1 bacterium RIFOXYC12_FULL_54_18 TaxID=1802584 RepID=A0A1F4T741_UNCSA|nr:MAG: threonine--tRNA ligase [candidate division WOR-1 bacterium RIFOXYA2_FULL_51_19]OGC17960.1 MAG: threonine--tRNA ligase [candidate division WOR-1 bacterium RIFOXYA12_FULL_52_29]OGC26817.1 MAG: threonine--tRNA ligase [candidate division WOR-1 bacterium RIFOXYB2_FULL_45_9]OGC28377.1 MAG: threonine--tRNA ligase [candidate division WOR-1 bacterium RIFOXYC12_FULL_54_18]OGC31167.1 MAG: threonine--tRNA ligase [candidate division WOR-1 bacterium RIFOXYB12_FULL_52_16]
MSKFDLETLRHSTSHILAQAVMEIFPGVKLGIGPSTDDGFYYDFDLPQAITPEDLPKIEKAMKDICKKNQKFERQEVSKEEAIRLFEEKGEKYKVEILNEIDSDKVSLYRNGDFVDLCRGPHVDFTGRIKAFKLLSIAGAYWRGIETNPMMQRIYGAAFPTKDELEAYLTNLEEAKKRDHRKLGKELDLFSLHEEAGAGLVYYHPKGAMLRSLIEDFMKKENLKRGYEQVYIPHIAKIDLWNTSGHTNYYRENMYFMKIDEQEYVVKPMNCPGHILIYGRKTRSYRDLPIRYFEFGTVYRYEKSGVLHGLLRVRGFTQDDAHIFCREDQLEGEIIQTLDFIAFVMKTFGFDFKINLSTRPESFAGTADNWDKAIAILEKALQDRGLPFEIDPGAGVFYGPKIDVKLKDSLGRAWQGPTVQVDFNLPQRFNLNYIGEDGKQKTPVMVHRAILGSLERFIGALIEHYGGAFPFWLAPTQVSILPVSDRHNDYAEKVSAQLKEAGIRVEVDSRRETIGAKIRNAQMQKVPYMLIVGDKEEQAGTVAIRSREKGEIGVKSIQDFSFDLRPEMRYNS